MKQAVIVSGARTAVGRAPRGTPRAARPDDLAGAAIAEALRRARGLAPAAGAAARPAAGRAPRGTLRATRPDDLAGAAIAEALRRAPGLDPAEVEDVILGCAIPEGAQGMNVARLAGVRAGVPARGPRPTVNPLFS